MKCDDIGVFGQSILLTELFKWGGVATVPDSAILTNIYAGESSAAMFSSRMEAVGTGNYVKQVGLTTANGFTTDQNYRVGGFVTYQGVRYAVTECTFTILGAESVSSIGGSVATDGSYITQGDIEDRWGSGNVVIWSDLNNTDTIDGDRVTRAINYAEAFVEDKFRRTNYQVPFTQTPKVLIDWMAVIAGWWLLNSRVEHLGDNADNEGVQLQYDEALRQISEYQSGQSVLDTGLVEDSQPEAPVVVL
jgi:phage gp36-like protein